MRCVQCIPVIMSVDYQLWNGNPKISQPCNKLPKLVHFKNPIVDDAHNHRPQIVRMPPGLRDAIIRTREHIYSSARLRVLKGTRIVS